MNKITKKQAVLLTCILSICVCIITSCNNTSLNTDTASTISPTSEPTPRPLSLRGELLIPLQDEAKVLQTELENVENNEDKKNEILDKLNDNVLKQMEIINGINNEKRYTILVERLEEYQKLIKSYIDNYEVEKAEELQEQVNIIMYGNKEGVKTWK